MSTGLMNHDEAEMRLQAAIDHPVFFQKLASFGIAPQTQEEAATMIELGSGLLVAHQQQETKQASGLSSLLAKAKQNIDQTLGVSKQASAFDDRQVNRIADELVNNADIYNSIVSLKAAEADYVRQQYGL